MKRWLNTLGLVLLFAAVSPSARAQQASFLNAPSPEKIAVTAGGVDIRTGRHTYSKGDLSIGDGPGSLKLERIMPTPIQGHIAPFGNFSHNWDVTLTIKASPLSQYPGSFDYVANVNFAGRSQTFEKLYLVDSVFRQKSQNEITRLTTTGAIGVIGAVYTYQATDGTVATFRPIANGECVLATYSTQCAHVSSIVEPDGTRFDFEYETGAGANSVRLRAVVSSRGYALLFQYGGGGGSWNHVTKACVVNLAVTAKPANNQCPVGAAAQAIYAYGAHDNRVVMTGATAPDNTLDSFTYTAVTPGESFQMGYRKAGQTSAWMTNFNEYEYTAEGDQEPVVKGQSFADGSGFTYRYDFTPSTADGSGQSTSMPTIAGGEYLNVLGHRTEVRYAFPPTPLSFNPPRVPGSNTGGGTAPPVNLGDVVYQVTPGPAQIIDPIGRVTLSDYCDANAKANLPPSERNRCLVRDLQSVTEPDGSAVHIKYGVNHNPVEIRRQAAPGSGLADQVETATYDSTACAAYSASCSKPLSVTDARGVVTNYTWDPVHAGMLTETRAAPTPGAVRPQKRYSYGQFYARYKNAAGTIVQSPWPVWLLTQISECRSGAAPACVGTADETRTTISYGAPGTATNLLPVSRTVAAGDGSLSATTSWTYDSLGNKLTEDGPLPGAADTTRWRYDAMRRVVGVITPDPDDAGPRKFRATRNTYDSAGRLVKVERGRVDSQSDAHWAAFTALEVTETAYDALDRKVREWTVLAPAAASGGTPSLTQYSYDLAGRLECTAVRMNPAVYASLPASACVAGTQGTGADDHGPDRITRLTYDAAGQLLKTTVAYGTPLQTDQETNTYTVDGQLQTVTDGENNRTTFEYDGHGRLSRTRYPVPVRGALTSSASDYEELGYDAGGNVLWRRLRDGQVIGYGYDALSRMTYKDLPGGATVEPDVSTVYDNLDRPTLVIDAAGNYAGSAYDALGRQTAQSGPLGVFGLGYDLAGRLTLAVHPDGTFFQYRYNTADLTGIAENGALLLVSYDYDDLGRRVRLARANGTVTTLTHDGVGRLKSYVQDLAGTAQDLAVNGPAQSGTAIRYNPAGQIGAMTRSNDLYAWTGHINVDRPYTANGLNQLTQAGSVTLGYDLRGNLTASGGDSYGYSSENRLISAQQGGSGNTALGYDPTGRLDRLVRAGVTLRFAHLGPRLVLEQDGAGAVLRRYVHGPGDDEPVVWYEGAGLSDRRYLHTDERGSVIALSDGSGALIALNRYDEYGIPATATAGGVPMAGLTGRFGYTGQVWLPELGLWYYKARIYSPTLGRFLQTDPIGYKDGINWYAYVGNDPINGTDFSGMQEDDEKSLVEKIGDELSRAKQEVKDELQKVGEDLRQAKTDVEEAGRDVEGAVTEDIPDAAATITDALGITDHAVGRREEARAGDGNRDVGDPNRVVREGRAYRDTVTGNTVYVSGNKVVVVGSDGKQVTQFKNSRQNTQDRVRRGRWDPM